MAPGLMDLYSGHRRGGSPHGEGEGLNRIMQGSRRERIGSRLKYFIEG